jgi:hypothetical protein
MTEKVMFMESLFSFANLAVYLDRANFLLILVYQVLGIKQSSNGERREGPWPGEFKRKFT